MMHVLDSCWAIKHDFQIYLFSEVYNSKSLQPTSCRIVFMIVYSDDAIGGKNPTPNDLIKESPPRALGQSGCRFSL